MKHETRQLIGQAVLETLEERRMMSSVSFAKGILFVKGSPLSANELRVNVSKDGSQLWAVTNNKTSEVYDASKIRQIRITGGEKNDVISVDVKVKCPVLVRAGDGDDHITTGRGKDVIFGGNGNDTIHAGGGADRVNGGNGNDEINGGDGDDRIDGGNGSDWISGGKGNDTIMGNSGDDTIGASLGHDRIVTGPGKSFARGGPGNDTLLGTAKDDLAGDDGDDLIDRKYNPAQNVSSGNDGSTGSGNGGTESPVSTKPQSVKSFSLINADTDEVIEGYTNIKGAQEIDLAKLPTRRLNVRANFDSEFTGSIWFGLNDVEKYSIENKAPYSFNHDLYGDYYAWIPSAGTYHITARTYSGEFGTGETGDDVVGVKFVFSDSNPPKEETNNGSSGSTGNTGNNGTGSDGSSDNNSGTIIEGAGTAAPDAVIKLITSGNIREGHSVHVSAMQSNLKGGSVLGMKYEWDFGDSGSKYNKLRGFNAAHLYENPGTYTITLKMTDAKGRSDSTKVQVNVSAANRRVIYVSNDGSDSNSGLAPSLAVKSIAKAESLIRDNTEILFKRGDKFNITDSFVVDNKSNVVVGAYGSGKSPVIYWSGNKPSSDKDMITVRNGTNVTVRDLTFDSKHTGTGKNYLTSVRPGGTNISVLNNTFLNVTEGVNSNYQPTGLLVQGNDAPTFLRGGFAWASGQYLVYLGNHLEDSSQENGMRVSGDGTRNLLFAYNDLRNSYKGSLVVQKSQYVYVYGNILRGEVGDDGDGGKVELGPLGKNTGVKGPDQRTKWVVFEENLVTEHSQLQLHHGLENVVVRNNVIKTDNLNSISIDGYSRAYERSVKKATIHNNTVVNNGTHGRFLWMGGLASDVSLINNLYVAPKVEVGKYSAAAVYVQLSDLRSFRTIDGNVWPVPKNTSGFYKDGINFVGATDQSANYLNGSRWNNLGGVGTDSFKNVTLGATYAVTAAGELVGSVMKK